MIIRQATIHDAQAMFQVEAACFPPTEAASLEAIEERLKLFSDICYVCEENGVIGFINGAKSKFETISDEFFEHMINDDGDNVLVFSLGVHPDHQRRGIGRLLLNAMIDQSRALNKKQIILTCKAHKVNYYASFGFKNDGIAESTHGGSVWYSMSMPLDITSEKEKMISGQMYDPMNEELFKDRLHSRRISRSYDSIFEGNLDERKKILEDFLGSCGENIYIESFKCDYGYNIHLGENFYANFDWVALDVCEIRIGDNCMIGPGVHIYTATHPLNASQRNAGRESGKPVIIGDNVWIGGNSVINPGVVLGNQVVVASGSVVTKSFPDNVLIGGNPAKIIKYID